MSWDASQIQIEQRVPRCARCGKMINLRGHYLELAGADGISALACSEICRDELSTIASPTPAGTETGSAE